MTMSNEQMQNFVTGLDQMKDGTNDALLEGVADAFVVCEDADRKRAEAIAYLESVSGPDKKAFIGQLADIVEKAGPQREVALRGLESYVESVLPVKE